MSSKFWMDLEAVEKRLTKFFGDEKKSINDFGRTVNQTFEAFVFAQVINWYKTRKWNVSLISPKGYRNSVRLKFNTRGRPDAYTYVRCERNGTRIQIRHALRVATKSHLRDQWPPANVVLDVAVIKDKNLSDFESDSFVPNKALVTFGEAKHMSAFAELIANFLGLVHEMLPRKLRTNSATAKRPVHPRPFLYVSGYLYRTAQGMRLTIKRRRLAVEIHDHTSTTFFSAPLPVKAPPTRRALRDDELPF